MLEFKKGIEHIAKDTEVPIIPVLMKGVRGSLLTFDIGSSTPNFSWFSSFRRRITIEIGDPLPASSKAPMLRQKLQ
jgi:1-acyl-sn-glycerol-3-phosphate acyltransferase